MYTHPANDAGITKQDSERLHTNLRDLRIRHNHRIIDSTECPRPFQCGINQ